MTERPPLKVDLGQFKSGYELRQVHEHGDALEFVREAQTNDSRIEEFDDFDVDDYDALIDLHKGEVAELKPDNEIHFGIWNENIFKGGISLLPNSKDHKVYLKFWLDKYAEGEGVATAALNGLVVHLDKERKLEAFNIVANIDSRNARAIRTLELAYFMEKWRDEDEVEFAPIWSIDAQDIELSGAVSKSNELLEFAYELMYNEPDAKYFDSKTEDGSKARVRIDSDFDTIPGDILIKFTVDEINHDDRYRYKLKTTFSIDPGADIYNFSRSIEVINRESGAIETRTLDSYLGSSRQSPAVSKNNPTVGKKRKTKKVKKFDLEMISDTHAKQLDDHLGLVMTEQHLNYLIGILANIKIKES